MTEKNAKGSSYIINFIYFQVRYRMNQWSKIVRQDMPTPTREALLYICSTAAPAPGGATCIFFSATLLLFCYYWNSPFRKFHVGKLNSADVF